MSIYPPKLVKIKKIPERLTSFRTCIRKYSSHNRLFVNKYTI
ncbi:hypothetical protein BN903_86 [Halorubrum sp. AJ67]|nr:hypothetical protein BN903_86 [Halorubrum sp. AJ67]